MRAAQHHGLDGHSPNGSKEPVQQAFHPGAGKHAGLHAFHQPRTGNGQGVLPVALHQTQKFGLRERHVRGHHHHVPVSGQERSGLERRFHADDRHVQLLPKRPGGRAGSRVAGDHHRLAVHGDQLVHRQMRKPEHLFRPLVAIGNVAGIAVIDEVFLRQHVQHLPQNADAAQAAVKYAYRPTIHRFPPPSPIIPAALLFFKYSGAVCVKAPAPARWRPPGRAWRPALPQGCCGCCRPPPARILRPHAG